MVDKSLEFYWEASENAPPLFTHIFQKHYSSPPTVDPVNPLYPYVSDMTSPLYASARGFTDFISYLKNYKLNYKSSHLLIIFGDDFMWENAQEGFF